MTVKDDLALLRRKRGERTVQGFIATLLVSLFCTDMLSALFIAIMGGTVAYLMWSLSVWDMEDIWKLRH